MLGIPADAPLILGVFRLSPEKRPGLFIEVVGRLKRQRPDLFALICGAGELTEAERSLMAAHGLGDRLLIRGDLGDLRAVMRTAALLLHVALHEGQPNAVLEAQALDLPVVSVRTGGTLEVLAPCLHPFSPPGDDPDDLVKACLSLLDDPGHARSLGIEAGVDVRARHRLDAMTAATLAAIGK
jgi:glycosyltransferase involved in cell wall biosynthesis